MKFAQFLAEAKDPAFWQKHPVVGFRGTSCPFLFFNRLFVFLKQKGVVSVDFLQTKDSTEVQKTLQQSFLGATSFYWLGDMGPVTKSRKKNTTLSVEQLARYTGPHRIAFFLSDEHTLSYAAEKKMTVITVEPMVNRGLMQDLVSFFERTKKGKDGSFLFGTVHEFILDTACVLMDYLDVTSTRASGDLAAYVLALAEPEASLLSLSRAFFAKEEQTFFDLWKRFHDEFPPVFWVTYWSEQLWRAYFTVSFLRKKKMAEARKMAFRLPFSFVRADWQNCSCKELLHAYKFLYTSDVALKKGSTFCTLDLFYFNYFIGSFS